MAISSDDQRDFVQRAVAQRRGQPQFRQGLVEVYGGRCCITDCDARPALEAAHISPYRGAHTNPLSNGLLLRADIHTLFDMYYLTVDASTVKVRLTNEWQRSQYGSFHGRMLRPPSSPDAFPDRTALAAHNGEFAVRHGSASGARGGRSTG